MSVFTGLSAFPITPVDARGALDEAALVRIVERVCAAGVSSIGLMGSTGGYPFHSVELRKRAARVAVEAAGGRVPVIVGVGALSTDTAIDLARDAGRAGADGLLLAPVSYTPLREAEVFQHYRAVAGATDLGVCLYNNPSTTHFSFSANLLARIAGLANVVAVKMPLPGDMDVAGDLARWRGVLPEGFIVGYSGDWGCADALAAEADAFYSALAGILPGPFVAMAGAPHRAGAVHAAMEPLLSLARDWGSIRVAHAIAKVQGIADAPLPRPLLPLDDTAMIALGKALAALPD